MQAAALVAAQVVKKLDDDTEIEMGTNNKNIFMFLRTVSLVLCLVCLLCACQYDGVNVAASFVDHAEEVMTQQGACWQAAFLDLFYDAMAKSSLRAYPLVTKSAMPLIMVAFAVWLSIKMLGFVSSVAQENAAQVWTEVVSMAFVCLCCGLLASSETMLLFVLNRIIFPIYYTFLEYGSILLNNITEDFDGYNNALVCRAPDLEDITMTSFPEGPKHIMGCLACAVSDRMKIGFNIAHELLAYPVLTSVIVGIVLYAVFIIVKFSFIFYLVDSIFRMNIVIIILPCLVLAYPFRATRPWTKTGFLMIINSSGIVMLMGLLASMGLMAMEALLDINADLIYNKNGKIDETLFSDFGVMPLAMILIGFMVLKSAQLGMGLTDSLVGGGGSAEFQKKIAKLAVTMAKKAFSAATGLLGKIAMRTSVGRAVESKIAGVGAKAAHFAGRK